MYINHFSQLENIIRKNLDKRGMAEVRLEGELEGAAASLLEGGTVAIVTGFVIRAAMKGETDGPVGAVSLAAALERLDRKVLLITDRHSESLLHSCCEAMGVKCPIEIIPSGGEWIFSCLVFNVYSPTHIVAVERPGRALDGCCYSMRGEDLSDIVPNTDILFEEAKKNGITTIAVGDGGNEVGMGKARASIVASLHNGVKICSAFSADFLIIAGVSNWGGHALAAALSIMSGVMLLHDSKLEAGMLKSIIEAGAVDGCTGEKALTVDGLSLEENLKILEQLRAMAELALDGEEGNRVTI